MKKYMLEICVDSVESAVAAKNGGADRIELCGHLLTGGVTPSVELYNEIRRTVDIPINVLIRPRFGDFLYSEHEFNILKNEVSLFKKLDADAVVIGCLGADGSLDVERMKQLIGLADNLKITLHRAFDVCLDPFTTLEQAQQLGISTILTSGQQNSCIDGMNLLDELINKQIGVDIMIGSGVNPQVIAKFLANTSASCFHMSAKKTLQSEMQYRKHGVNMGIKGISEFEIWRTDEKTVREAVELLNPSIKQ